MKTINPFPMTLTDGRIVVNELCTCGHFRTQHGGLVHHGMCLAGPNTRGHRKLTPLVCRCHQFRWAQFVLADEAK